MRGVVVYCQDYKCSHSQPLNADQWPDDLRLSDIEQQFVCKACGKRGADVRPDFTRAQRRPLPKTSLRLSDLEPRFVCKAAASEVRMCGRTSTGRQGRLAALRTAEAAFNLLSGFPRKSNPRGQLASQKQRGWAPTAPNACRHLQALCVSAKGRKFPLH
jgi:hypothetical protein